MDNIFILAPLAILAGVSLGINRVFLGKLGSGLGPANASVINHIGGAIFILIILLATGVIPHFNLFTTAPIYAYFGGIIGALFVALTSWLIPRAGVMKTSILLISGQMILGTILDYSLGKIDNPIIAIIGLSLIIAGVIFGEVSKRKRNLN
jgi:transporter family-2 protein